jgi:hypothetical protein
VIPRQAAIGILGIAVASPVLAIAGAPVVAIVTHLVGLPNYAAHYRLVAQAAEKVWRETTPDRLRIVGSYDNLLYGTVFYFADRPSAYEIASPNITPWVDNARIARDGLLLYCPVAELLCMNALAARTADLRGGRRVEVEISRSFLGMSSAPVRYTIVAIPPPGPRPISP